MGRGRAALPRGSPERGWDVPKSLGLELGLASISPGKLNDRAPDPGGGSGTEAVQGRKGQNTHVWWRSASRSRRQMPGPGLRPEAAMCDRKPCLLAQNSDCKRGKDKRGGH